jgi:hypothetical protein
MQVTHGRGLREDDPLFPNLQHARGEAISDQAIGLVLARYAPTAGARPCAIAKVRGTSPIVALMHRSRYAQARSQ